MESETFREVVVASVTNPMEADVLRSVLAANGIATRYQSPTVQLLKPVGAVGPAAEIQLMVAADQAEDASRLLSTYTSSPPMERKASWRVMATIVAAAVTIAALQLWRLLS